MLLFFLLSASSTAVLAMILLRAQGEEGGLLCDPCGFSPSAANNSAERVWQDDVVVDIIKSSTVQRTFLFWEAKKVFVMVLSYNMA